MVSRSIMRCMPRNKVKYADDSEMSSKGPPIKLLGILGKREPRSVHSVACVPSVPSLRCYFYLMTLYDDSSCFCINRIVNRIVHREVNPLLLTIRISVSHSKSKLLSTISHLPPQLSSSHTSTKMPKYFPSISEDLAEWAMAQPLFFTASAPTFGKHINMSPKGLPSTTFQILGGNSCA